MSEKYQDSLSLPPPSGLPPAPTSASAPARARWSSLLRAVGLVARCALASLALTRPELLHIASVTAPILSDDGSTLAFDWHPCSDGHRGQLGDRFDCATYEVPMDWSDKHHREGSEVVKLAVIRYKVDKGVKRLGSLFTNPGGPGGSGVSFVSLAGPSLNVLTEGRWDVISWDPRGVGKTEPTFRCFDSAVEESLFIQSVPQVASVPYNLTAFPHALKELKTQVKATIPYSRLLNVACQQKNERISQLMGTESVVRDLEVMSRAAWKKGDVEKGVNFWGFSYGTIVGAYLTGIFPDRLGRVVIDGVVDPVRWQSGTEQAVLSMIFRDTDKALESFVEECLKAGHTRCALAEHPTQSKEALLQTLADLVDKTYKEPILVDDISPPGVITSPLVSLAMFLNLYAPRAWPGLATILKDLLDGDGRSLLALKYILQPPVIDPTLPASSQFAGNGVWCTDAKRTILSPGATTEELADLWVKGARHRTGEVSSWFGWMGLWNSCDGWTSKEAGPGRFTGTFNQTLSNDFLMIGNSADPVTSVKNAYRLQSIQPQSRVIHQNSAGHCSLALASLCTLSHLQTYLIEGELPKKNVFCEVDEGLFPVAGVTSFGEEADEAQVTVLNAARDVGETLRAFTHGQ